MLDLPVSMYIKV